MQTDREAYMTADSFCAPYNGCETENRTLTKANNYLDTNIRPKSSFKNRLIMIMKDQRSQNVLLHFQTSPKPRDYFQIFVLTRG